MLTEGRRIRRAIEAGTLAIAGAVAGMLTGAVPSLAKEAAPPATRHADAPAFLAAGKPMRNHHRDVTITMRDGVKLAADLYLPRAAGRYPVIIEVTPYGKRGDTSFVAERDFWADRGYAFLIVDARGQHGSGGTFTFFRDAIDDGYDIVEWAGTQTWSTGSVGMRGSSYSGTYPWFAARNAPPHLKCINPNASVARSFEELPYHGGAFKQQWGLTWISALSDSGVKPGQTIDWDALLLHRPLMTADVAAFGEPMRTYRQMLSHPTLDSFWQPINLRAEDYGRIAIPSLAFSGWFDGTLPGTIAHYQGMRAHSPARDAQYLVVGPWEHFYAADGGWDYVGGERVRIVGDLTFPEHAFLPGQQMTAQFFDWCLKGAPKPDLPSARVYVTGADQWLLLDEYPAKAVQAVPFYLAGGAPANGLAGGGVLTTKKPSGGETDSFVYAPGRPVPSQVMRKGVPTNLNSAPIDITQLLSRPDVLVYASAPLESAVTVLGNVRMILFAASSATDTDFTAQIEDVAPDGSAVKLGPQNGGIIRARYRDGFESTRPLTPGSIERYSIDLFDIGHQFRAGHRIRVSISSSNWPLYHRNPNTGNPIATDEAEPVKARQTIHRNAKHASHILLPVITNLDQGR